MAVTKIYAIKVTPQNSLNYDKSDKESTIIKKKNDSADSINYVMRDKKGIITELSNDYLNKMKAYITIEGDKVLFKTITTALHCSIDETYDDWQDVREKMNRKNGSKGNIQYCIPQNFGTDIDPMLANEIGVKFAEEYLSDYQCIVSTHINTGYVHNHIEFNATSYITGKKYHDCLKSVQEIREISDRLCKEYKLDVLDDTKDMKLVRYKDEKGNTKFFEPTERKRTINEGEYSNKNDYRNTVQFSNIEEYKDNHVDVLKNDIDRLLPYSTSYDNLLDKLRDIGYEIKDKTKSGDWRKNISFKATSWDKFTRDKSLGEEYQRENLTLLIEKNAKKILNNDHVYSTNSDKQFDNNIYQYGRIVIEDMDEEYRYKKNKDKYEKIKRSDIEKTIIIDTKKANKEIDKTLNKSLYTPYEREQTLVASSKRTQYFIDRINSNLKTLRFVEDKEIKSFTQINNMVSVLYDKRNSIYKQMNMIAQGLKNANVNIQLIKKYNDLNNLIHKNTGVNEYDLYEADTDKDLLSKYKEMLKQRNLLDRDKQEKYIENYTKFNQSFKALNDNIEKINKQIKEYDSCVYNIGRADKEYDNRYESNVNNYYEIKSKYNNNAKER